ncbi:hypothetical protein PV721_39245 [Streptomyces sp. MB09-01]|uniref:hypothetical protein n=1 Tax=Streptomyces sp. MB09-01 TaxID=3028666 RepID=UPI0029B72A38|nr:hypothetical protein [Streptomyces sp. MB09-01]MDX3540240.1 hypothetical protein [Streptomyces sp. MB09-01]
MSDSRTHRYRSRRWRQDDSRSREQATPVLASNANRLSGWSTDEDADALAALSAGTFGLTVKHLAAPGTPPLAVLGEARVIDRFRSGTGGLRLTIAWPAGLRGTAASGPGGGLVRHGIAYAGPGAACVCRRHDCGGLVPVSWCAEHGDAAGPVLEWHPEGGIRCTDLRLGRLASGSPVRGSTG